MWLSWCLSSAMVAGQVVGAETLPTVNPAPRIVPVQVTQPGLPTDLPKEEEPAPASGDKQLLMELLDGTRFGQRLDKNGIVIKGLTNGNFTASTAPKTNLPLAMNYQANQFLLEQNALIIEKAIDTSSDEFNWGFKSYNILPGSDYRFTLSNNLADSQLRMNNGLPNTYGVDPTEFYVQGYLPGLQTDVKVGRFATIIFNETIDPTGNRLVSRALTFMNNPFTNSGAIATTKINDNWTMANGIVAGNDVFFGPAGNPAYLGGIKWEGNEKNTSLAFNTTLGSAQFNQYLATNNQYDVFELLLSHNITEKLNYTLDVMYSLQNNIAGVSIFERDGVTSKAFEGNATWYGFVNYLTYTWTDSLATTARFEVFDDNKGYKTGFEGIYTTYTLGAVYKFTDGLWLRPEFRYDYNGTSAAYSGENGLFTAAADFIIRW